MGFNHSGTRLLCYAKTKGVDFAKTLTIGRQGLHLDETSLQNNLNEFGFNSLSAHDIITKEKGYAEPFLKALGALDAHSLDASDYESATIIQDMNKPMSDEHKEKYSLVIDGGSLEHVFNFPVAVKNCMNLVKTGGHYIGITPTNNLFGHGFYQFSPELYFRVFSKENGFEMQQVIFYQDKKNSAWYDVKDPNEVKSRVILSNNHPSYLFIIAKKIANVEIFSTTPQQSDYQHISWVDKGNMSQINNNQKKLSFGKKISIVFKRFTSLFNDFGDGDPNHFTKIK